VLKLTGCTSVDVATVGAVYRRRFGDEALFVAARRCGWRPGRRCWKTQRCVTSACRTPTPARCDPMAKWSSKTTIPADSEPRPSRRSTQLFVILHRPSGLLQHQGDPTAARPLFERALAIRERVLGPDHPDTVATRRAFAEITAEGDWPAAGG
jgi:hypothetical protein